MFISEAQASDFMDAIAKNIVVNTAEILSGLGADEETIEDFFDEKNTKVLEDKTRYIFVKYCEILDIDEVVTEQRKVLMRD